MFTRYCPLCDIRTNSPVCSCGRTTDVLTRDGEYTQDDMQEDIDNTYREKIYEEEGRYPYHVKVYLGEKRGYA